MSRLQYCVGAECLINQVSHHSCRASQRRQCATTGADAASMRPSSFAPACRWLRLPLTGLATAGCLLTVYDSLATENARVHQPRKLEETEPPS